MRWPTSVAVEPVVIVSRARPRKCWSQCDACPRKEPCHGLACTVARPSDKVVIAERPDCSTDGASGNQLRRLTDRGAVRTEVFHHDYSFRVRAVPTDSG